MINVATDTKQKLIDTALELLWKNSYGSVSVDDICKAADVKKGSFYHFFPSKVDLAIAAMEESTRDMKQHYDDMFSASIPPVKRFERMADFVYGISGEIAAKYGQVCGCPCSSLGSEIAGKEDAVREKFEAICSMKERYYESALRDMVAEGILPKATDVKARAQEITAYLIGQLMMARIQNDLDFLKRDLKEGLLRTLGIKEKTGQVA